MAIDEKVTLREYVDAWFSAHLREHQLLEKAVDLARGNTEWRLMAFIGAASTVIALATLMIMYFRHP